MDVFDLVAKISLDTTEYENNLDTASSETSTFGSKLKSGLGTAAKVGAAALAAGVGAIVKFGKDSVETGKEFDQGMSQIAATLGITTEDIQNNVNGAGDTFDALRQKAQEMGSATNFTATEAAEGLNILAMSGYDAESSIAMIEDVLHLSAAGAMDMASAAGYVAGAMKGFNDETKDSGYYADLMAKGATLANTSVQQLGEAISSGAAGAAAYNQSADSMTVALLRLAEQGEVGSAAGTALSAAMKSLYTPTDQAKEALNALGIAAYDENGAARDFNAVINELNNSLAGMTDEEANAYKQTIFSIQGLNAYNKMVVTGVDKQEEWADALAQASDGAGEASKQYDTMTDNLQGDIDILGSALDGFKLAVSDRLTPTIREFVQFGSDGLAQLTEAFQSGGLTGAADALGDIISRGVAKISEKMPMILEAGKKLVVSLTKGISEALPQIVEMLPDLISTFIDLVFEVVNAILTALPQIIETLATALPTIVTTIITKLMEHIPELIQGVIQLVLAIVDAIPVIIEGLVNALPQIIEAVVGGLIKALPQLIAGLVMLVLKIVENLPTIIMSLIRAIPTIIFSLVNVMVDEFPQFIDAIIELVTNIGKEVSEWAGNLWNSIKEWFTDLIEYVREEFWSIVGKVVELWENIKEKVSTALSDVWSSISAWFNDTVAKVGGWLTDAWNSVIEFFTNIGTTVTNSLATVWDNISGWFSDTWAKIGGFIDDAWEWGKNLVLGIWNGVSDWAGWLWSKISGFFDNIWSGIKNFFGIHSPSTKMAWIAQMDVKGIAQGFKKYGDEAVNAALDVAENVEDVFQNAEVGFDTTDAQFADLSQISGQQRGMGAITINVYGAEGQDVSVLADEVAEKLQWMVDRKQVVYG